MKKALSIIIALILLVSLAGCNTADGEQSKQTEPQGKSERVITLQNATVNGKDSLTVSTEGTFTAKANIPDEETAVDYWLVDGQMIVPEAGETTLEFKSKGVNAVTAVLREKLNVTCVGCYVQYLDEDNNPDGEELEKVYFEEDYVNPVTEEECVGGSISVCITAKVEDKPIEYWIINGAEVHFDETVTSFVLFDLTQPLDIEVVFSDHVHDHQYSANKSYSATCTAKGKRVYICACGDSYSESIAALGHKFKWVNDGNFDYRGGGTHTQVCERCGATGTTANHRWSEREANGRAVCLDCGQEWWVIN